MADTDEAAIHLPSHDSAAHIDTDLSDETQDFRMLSNLSFLADTSQATLPKRGEKDFEPNPTLYQADILDASRQAMHNALAHPRLHNPKNQIIAIYAPDGPAPPRSVVTPKTLDTIAENDTPAQTAEAEESQSKKPTGTGTNVHPDSCVYVTNPKGQFFKNMGRADRWGRIWLLPEEALYMLERGSLDVRWPRSATGCEDDGETEDSGIPMSLQAAYACFIGHGGLTVDRFSVYSGLRRLGYTLIRAPGWYDEAEEEFEDPESTKRQGPGLAGIYGRFMDWLHSSTTTAVGPVAGLGIHRNYNDIYRKLSIIPFYDPTAPLSQNPQTKPPFRVVFHVYKPSTPFRKSAPPAPDFRVAVVNARTQTTVPTLAQLGTLLESTPLDPPKGEKMERNLYMRLRHGYRNVVLAVVDQGVVSYLRVADVAFGKEKLYNRPAPSGNKRGANPRNPRPKPKGR
ncbi:tRNA-splicing endonuclease subunit sen54 N-term-domain-containing protein [Aspergillus transmontanensis]|uniref:tRNA-splicing endonuclease subunit sen54 N-term-domain-containing protein n=1 Tax=Aspergillus transmontanensis TaxID=1034304 RepID=A0A5N6W6Q4_9EURO|nr:tRNA-splicing endonuclease subunit sen54 N-term-domain-containing protein [Aspergillus transmontanensis]